MNAKDANGIRSERRNCAGNECALRFQGMNSQAPTRASAPFHTAIARSFSLAHRMGEGRGRVRVFGIFPRFRSVILFLCRSNAASLTVCSPCSVLPHRMMDLAPYRTAVEQNPYGKRLPSSRHLSLHIRAFECPDLFLFCSVSAALDGSEMVKRDNTSPVESWLFRLRSR